MIVVTGATGTVGRQVVAQLRERDMPGRAVTRPEPVTRAVEEITGVPARTFRRWAGDHISDFR